MSFQKTKRAHAVQPGDQVRISGLDGPVHSGMVQVVQNSPKQTHLEFDDGWTIDLSRNHPVEILNPRG